MGAAVRLDDDAAASDSVAGSVVFNIAAVDADAVSVEVVRLHFIAEDEAVAA